MSALLAIEELKVHFPTGRGPAPAVDGVSYEVAPGAAVGVVGESGCGKTVSALAILRLVPRPGVIAGGRIIFKGRDLLTLTEEEMRQLRGDQIGMIFQEPMTALNPVFTIGDQVAETLRLHRGMSKKEAWAQAVETLGKVGVPVPESRARDYPHQLSGGLRQRAMIAMAVACGPSLLIADEPTTALDVTIQAQILDLMLRMREQTASSLILITHDLGVVAQTCGEVVVMYAGKVAERASVKTLFADPKHPYTWGLLDSLPSRSGARHKQPLREIKGTVPSLLNLPKGCLFNPRCPKVMDICRTQEPELKPVNGGTFAACWLY
ncbi:MAG: ABC transporter ATP-binding protein [Nitrospinae bacterium]|nr:ABC transporter ATP-binding protein [Nitrospinota bacterium]